MKTKLVLIVIAVLMLSAIGPGPRPPKRFRAHLDCSTSRVSFTWRDDKRADRVAVYRISPAPAGLVGQDYDGSPSSFTSPLISSTAPHTYYATSVYDTDDPSAPIKSGPSNYSTVYPSQCPTPHGIVDYPY